MTTLVPGADASHVIRAAVRYFAESAAQYEQEVYLREQMEFAEQGPPAIEGFGVEDRPTVKSAYAESEWTRLAQVIVLAPLNMSLNVGKPGMIKTVKEVAALASGIKALVKEKYKDNELIQALLADFKDLEQSMNRERLDYEQTLAEIKAAAEIVEQRASPEEAQGYKQFLIDLTEHTANAAGEGFMGSGEKVSQAEIDYIDVLKSRL